MTKHQRLEELAAISLIAHDIHLFLDVNPRCEQAVADFTYYSSEYRKLAQAYEKDFGPLTIASGADNVTTRWVKEPWPWKNEGGL